MAASTRPALASPTSTGWWLVSFALEAGRRARAALRWYWRQESHPHLLVRSQASCLLNDASPRSGAGIGSRTLVGRLRNGCSALELHRHVVDAGVGIEPTSPASEAGVLPLDHPAAWSRERESNSRLRRMKPTSCPWTIPHWWTQRESNPRLRLARAKSFH